MFLNRIMNTVPLGSPVKFTPHLCSAIKILPFSFIPILLHTLLCQYWQAPTIRFMTIHQFLITIANISTDGESGYKRGLSPFRGTKFCVYFESFIGSKWALLSSGHCQYGNYWHFLSDIDCYSIIMLTTNK